MTFPDQSFKEYAAFAERLAEAARGQTLHRFRNHSVVFNKAGPWFDPVTDADREAERVQRDMIANVYPAHGVIGEEFGATVPEAELRWVLDPVDGTRAFVCGVQTWTTLIALEHNAAPVIGLIDQPYTDERWLAVGGQTTFRHGTDVADCCTSSVTELDKARISTTDPRPIAYFNDKEAEAFARLSRQSRVARFSMDAYAYGLLALGEIDLVVEAGLQHHDYAALRPVVEGAGGVMTNWSGEPVGSDERGETIAAATPQLHEAAMKILSS